MPVQYTRTQAGGTRASTGISFSMNLRSLIKLGVTHQVVTPQLAAVTIYE